MTQESGKQLDPSEVIIDGEGTHITIPGVGEMEPFLMSVISSTDLWMFIASNGGLTAGRVDAAGAIFSYETVDRLFLQPSRAGSVTHLRLPSGEVWSPLDGRPSRSPIDRSLSKSALGDEVLFEERRPEHGLVYRLSWRPSDRFGWVRTVELENIGPAALDLDVLDGLLDVLPAQVDTTSQQRASNLIDAYRHCELHPARSNLALYGLSSLLTDRAEPSEALRVNAVWRLGPEGTTHLSPRTVKEWWRNAPSAPSEHLRGQKGAHLFRHRSTLEPGHTVRWRTVLDAQLDHRQVAALSEVLESGDAGRQLESDLEASRQSLMELARSVDGWQRSGDRVVDLNHLSNTLFNGLRGGFLVNGGYIPRAEVKEVLRLRNAPVARRRAGWGEQLPELVSPGALRASAQKEGDPELERLVDEVLPLAFGRRHGDPSRPWNRFSIRTRDEAGRPRLAYEGNWRDIFQNWEALAASYPDYLPSIIAKFVNASTVDGFNPYRISKEGVDWEVPDPEDPWSNIGYWGDHQMIYLLRLLEALERYRPKLLDEMLDARKFAFADVPYRIADFDRMLVDASETIDFDEARQAAIEARVAELGSDGRLVSDAEGIVHTHLWEKLLIPFAAKVSSLVVDGGIWMNTQRPEWNDANNALPGAGLSVVTLAHTLRFGRFLLRLARRREAALTVSADVRQWLGGLADGLAHAAARRGPLASVERRAALEAWGRAFSDYRACAYSGWSREQETLEVEDLRALLEDAERVLERSFRANRRADGLFHAYNVLGLDDGGATVEHLPPMLEGQVAALDAQVLAPAEVTELIDALFASALYQADRGSFLLYPDKRLPDFEEKNRVPEGEAKRLACVRRWLEAGDGRVLLRDAKSTLRFAPSFRNAKALDETLEGFEGRGELEEGEREELLNLYEATFGHRSFTGRSQGMYGFEGLGCIYWHMVAKLLLAIREAFELAGEAEAEPLCARYHRVRSGLGFNKTPLEYGAFPTDAYSHTPGHSGAQQPGMTGQVKEQVLTRWGELGLRLRDGRLGFSPRLLPPEERLETATRWNLPDRSEAVDIPAGGVGFVFAGVPVVLGPAKDGPGIRCHFRSDAPRWFEGEELDEATTRAWLERSGDLAKVEVKIGGPVWMT